MKVALIGAGGIGKQWAKALEKSTRLQVAAVVDSDASKAAEVASVLGARPETDWRAVSEHVDAAIVAVPHKYLAPISQGFLQAGKHVLCEKPGGVSSKEVSDVAALAASKKLVYMPGLNHRFHAAYLEVKKRVDAGAIGDLMFVRARYGFGGRKDYDKEWRFDKSISGGGELIDQGIHMIDMARWFLGDFTDVTGFAENMFWGGSVEDNGFALLRTADKKVAQVHVSWTNWDWIHCFEIFGKKGYLRIDGLDSRYHGPERLTIGRADPKSGAFPEEEVVTFANESKEDSFLRESDVFADAIDGKAVGPSGQDVVRAIEVVEKIYGR